jgi:hypothetical protein
VVLVGTAGTVEVTDETLEMVEVEVLVETVVWVV